MLLGKRPRPPMKRTTSLSEISFDLQGDSSSSSHQQTNPTGTRLNQPGSGPGAGGFGMDQRVLSSMVSPKNNNNFDRRHSADFLETPHFLKSCGLCKRRLVPGRDVYMYRGDSAFCSLECRQQQMNQDERKEKCSFASSKKQSAGAGAGAGAGSQVSSTKGETVAAV